MTHDERDDRMDEAIRDAAQDYNRPPAVPREEMWARIEAARAASRLPSAGVRTTAHRSWTWSAAAAAAVLLVGIGIGYRLRGSAGPGDSTVAAAEPRASTEVAAARPAAADTGVDSSAAPAADSRRPSARAAATPEPRLHVAERPGTRDGAATAQGDAGSDVAYRLAVAEHLVRTEALLTSFRAEARTGAVDAQVAAWARDLLRTTRLMEAAPGTSDPTMRRLLGDLELVLVQIAQYSGAAAPQGSAQRSEELDLIEQSIDRRGVLPKLRAAIPPGMIPAGT